MSTTTEAPRKADRECIYVKLRFLSTVIGGMGEKIYKGEMDDADLWAIDMLLSDIAHEIYPEWKEGES